MTIVQGLANHVSQNAEALRSKFVPFEGKKKLIVSRPDFVKGSKTNDWEGVFPEFASLIDQSTSPGVAQLVQADFTTTTLVENLVSKIALMDTVQHYFEYEMVCGCGFPSIELTGTPGDWERIRAKAEQLKAFDLDFWLVVLLPVLDEFVQAAHKRPNLAFWRSLVISSGPSGMPGDPLSGWVQAFFPYLNASAGRESESRLGGFTPSEPQQRKLERNSALANYMESIKNNVTLSNFDRWYSPIKSGTKIEYIPPGLCKAPVTYNDVSTGKTFNMAFCGGITSIVQHEDHTIEPKVGWAVMDFGEQK